MQFQLTLERGIFTKKILFKSTLRHGFFKTIFFQLFLGCGFKKFKFRRGFVKIFSSLILRQASLKNIFFNKSSEKDL